ncbi:hypothetical protein GGI43DRAFT_396118 [Trichoderma evansii]
MNEYLCILSYYGYDILEVDCDHWKAQVDSVQRDEEQEQGALTPLFHMATNNLPTSTRALELDDRNAVSGLEADAGWWTGVKVKISLQE